MCECELVNTASRKKNPQLETKSLHQCMPVANTNITEEKDMMDTYMQYSKD